MKRNEKITILEFHEHSKASEVYVHTIFKYENYEHDLWIPIAYRRTGINIPIENKEEVRNYLESIYPQLDLQVIKEWKRNQELFWKSKKATVTKSFFDALSKKIKWVCCSCELPNNPNFARRIQDLKEMGYTIATDTNKLCNKCGKKGSHLLLIPIKRAESSGNGYETFSKKLRKKILLTLNNLDAYECKKTKHLLPDHKFSEIRWDKFVKSNNSDDMTEEEIRKKFQLLTNQRNQEKREVCRNCFQTGKRGIIFGIPFFSVGNENWDSTFPATGKEAEQGCQGCPWYDINDWRKKLIERLKSK